MGGQGRAMGANGRQIAAHRRACDRLFGRQRFETGERAEGERQEGGAGLGLGRSGRRAKHLHGLCEERHLVAGSEHRGGVIERPRAVADPERHQP